MNKKLLLGLGGLISSSASILGVVSCSNSTDLNENLILSSMNISYDQTNIFMTVNGNNLSNNINDYLIFINNTNNSDKWEITNYSTDSMVFVSKYDKQYIGQTISLSVKNPSNTNNSVFVNEYPNIDLPAPSPDPTIRDISIMWTGDGVEIVIQGENLSTNKWDVIRDSDKQSIKSKIKSDSTSTRVVLFLNEKTALENQGSTLKVKSGKFISEKSIYLENKPGPTINEMSGKWISNGKNNYESFDITLEGRFFPLDKWEVIKNNNELVNSTIKEATSKKIILSISTDIALNNKKIPLKVKNGDFVSEKTVSIPNLPESITNITTNNDGDNNIVLTIKGTNLPIQINDYQIKQLKGENRLEFVGQPSAELVKIKFKINSSDEFTWNKNKISLLINGNENNDIDVIKYPDDKFFVSTFIKELKAELQKNNKTTFDGSKLNKKAVELSSANIKSLLTNDVINKAFKSATDYFNGTTSFNIKNAENLKFFAKQDETNDTTGIIWLKYSNRNSNDGNQSEIEVKISDPQLTITGLLSPFGSISNVSSENNGSNLITMTITGKDLPGELDKYEIKLKDKDNTIINTANTKAELKLKSATQTKVILEFRSGISGFEWNKNECDVTIKGSSTKFTTNVTKVPFDNFFAKIFLEKLKPILNNTLDLSSLNESFSNITDEQIKGVITQNNLEKAFKQAKDDKFNGTTSKNITSINNVQFIIKQNEKDKTYYLGIKYFDGKNWKEVTLTDDKGNIDNNYLIPVTGLLLLPIFNKNLTIDNLNLKGVIKKDKATITTSWIIQNKEKLFSNSNEISNLTESNISNIELSEKPDDTSVAILSFTLTNKKVSGEISGFLSPATPKKGLTAKDLELSGSVNDNKANITNEWILKNKNKLLNGNLRRLTSNSEILDISVSADTNTNTTMIISFKIKQGASFDEDGEYTTSPTSIEVRITEFAS